MNTLEKILEKIIDELKEEGIIVDDDRGHRAVEIIRSHMDEAKDTNVHTNDDLYILLTINENGVAEEYDDTYDITIHCESEEEQDRVSKILENYHGWIPVEEKLPEVNERVLVTVKHSCWIADFNSNWVPEEKKIKHPETSGTYIGCRNENGIWIFIDEEGQENICDKEFGQNLGRLYDVVTHWRPLPEPYKPKEDISAAEHIMSRFMKVE